ncbi:MAG TPA: AAA family ATPase, partial [Chloroflexaceae bacterium]|nr:AAA family ATPase [Chloroflexaceae bacterium]
SNRYISDRFLPDKAIDLIDEAAARRRMENTSTPQVLDDMNRLIAQREIEREMLGREKDATSKERLARIEQELANLKEQRNAVEAQKQHEKGLLDRIQELRANIEQTQNEIEQAQRQYDYNKVAELQYGRLKGLEDQLAGLEAQASNNTLLRQEVNSQDIAEIIARWTGVPVTRLLEGEVEKLIRMEERLHQRVVGQGEAVAAVANAVRRARAGLQDPNRPLGSFLFLGPTGVGKTELARALAEFLFDDEGAMVRIDMSEYMEKHTVARLIGAPPGYVGYDEGGQLTEAVRRKPYSVVLFDEVEKAHPDVFNVLLQVLDDGRLTDGQGRVVNFKNVVVIMTSNVGSAMIQDMTQDRVDQESIREAVLDELRSQLRPEFLNRIDEVIVFQPLSREQIGQIVEIQLARLRALLAERKLSLELSEAARAQLAAEGYDPIYGARPLKRVIQQRIQNPLAMAILEGRFQAGDTVLADAGEGGFSFRRAE